MNGLTTHTAGLEQSLPGGLAEAVVGPQFPRGPSHRDSVPALRMLDLLITFCKGHSARSPWAVRLVSCMTGKPPSLPGMTRAWCLNLLVQQSDMTALASSLLALLEFHGTIEGEVSRLAVAGVGRGEWTSGLQPRATAAAFHGASFSSQSEEGTPALRGQTAEDQTRASHSSALRFIFCPQHYSQHPT